jgi:hypothetical protein
MSAGILTLCCGCGAVLVDAPPGPNGEISHGLCEACLRARAADFGFAEEDIQEILADEDD